MFRRLIYLFLITAFLIGCASSSKRSDSDIIIPPKPIGDTGPSYIIGPGDVLRVAVWKNAELSVEIPVRPDGYLSVPLIGDILADGRPPEAVGQEIEKKLSQYVRSPKVSLIVTKLVSHEYLSRVRVVGAVADPRSASFRKGMTILDLVLEAGGVNEFAEEDRTNLYRKDGDTVMSYPVYLGEILHKGRLETNYLLEPGDVISIPERRF